MSRRARLLPARGSSSTPKRGSACHAAPRARRVRAAPRMTARRRSVPRHAGSPSAGRVRDAGRHQAARSELPRQSPARGHPGGLCATRTASTAVTPSYARRWSRASRYRPARCRRRLGSGKGRALRLAASYPFKRAARVVVRRHGAAANIDGIGGHRWTGYLRAARGGRTVLSFPPEPDALPPEPLRDPVLEPGRRPSQRAARGETPATSSRLPDAPQAELLDAVEYLRPALFALRLPGLSHATGREDDEDGAARHGLS